MTRQRVWIVFGIAWLAAALLSWVVYSRATAPASGDIVKIVAAAHELQVGRRLAAEDLKLVDVPRKNLPAGYLSKVTDALDRAVLFSLGVNELVLESKLAPKQGGEGLTAIIEPGKRAMTVQVNETIGVAGFVQPGTKVDVLFTRTLPNGDAAATTILQNIPVLAYGRNLQRPAATGAPQGGGGAGVSGGPQNTVTLLVTQEEAEKLALAVQRGKIQLALRNPLDSKSTASSPVYLEDLGIEELVKESSRRGARDPSDPPPAPPKPKDPREGKIVIKVFRGSKVTEDIF